MLAGGMLYTMRLPVLAAVLAVSGVTAPAAAVAADRQCYNRDAGPSAFSISYRGSTNCGEALLLTRTTPERIGTRTIRHPHATWRCTTVRSRYRAGVLEAWARATCNLRGERRKARVRWYLY